MTSVTDGFLLGGRVVYRQAKSGFRSGIEPVLLAASIPAKPGERVLEGGAGAGAALLCLAARVPDLTGVGIELVPEQAALALANAAANAMGGLSFESGDVGDLTLDGIFDHAFANPPYHTTPGTPSPSSAREMAKRGSPDLLTVWAKALGRVLRPRGTLTFVLPVSTLPACFGAMVAAGCAPDVVVPLWPKPASAAKLMIVRGIKSGRGALQLLPGLILHKPDGSFTDEAEQILRFGAPFIFRPS